LGLALGIGFAGAQTINKALQLSQDATGQFGVDTNLGLALPGHLLWPTGGTRPAPTVSSGATTPTIVGTDSAGVVTMSAVATTATVTFGTAFASVPWCLVSMNGTITTTISYTVATTSLAITGSGAVGANNKATYYCPSAS
jgi:hypothetical protein